MDGCAGNNFISVKRSTYTAGKRNSVSEKMHNSTQLRKTSCANTSKTVTECARVKEKYVVSKGVNTENKRRAAVVSSRNRGFTYVEHCGVSGTIRDVVFTKKVKSNQRSCFDKVVTIVLFAVLLFFVAGSYCEYYDTFNEIKRIESEIGECREEQLKLLMAIEERDNEINIEEYAVNTLGMVKADKLTRHYVNISGKDVVTISQNNDEGIQAQGVLLSGFKNIIGNLLGQK